MPGKQYNEGGEGPQKKNRKKTLEDRKTSKDLRSAELRMFSSLYC